MGYVLSGVSLVRFDALVEIQIPLDTTPHTPVCHTPCSFPWFHSASGLAIPAAPCGNFAGPHARAILKYLCWAARTHYSEVNLLGRARAPV